MSSKDYAYGILPLKKIRGEWHILLVQHGRSKYWGFPKGHSEKKESPREAAIRELFEETQLKVSRFLSENTFKEHYFFYLQGKLISKTVEFFPAEVVGEVKLQEEELSGHMWLQPDQALSKLTYEGDKGIMQQLITFLQYTP